MIFFIEDFHYAEYILSKKLNKKKLNKDAQKPFLIAEIGINHNGDLKIAKKLILNAKEANFDAVKFQKRDINLVYSKEIIDSPRESPWGKTQRDQKWIRVWRARIRRN